MKDRPDFIKNCEELRTDESFSYPNDSETFGTGASLGRTFGLERVAINYEVLAPGDRSSWPHAHTLLNNTDKNVRALVMGECHVPTDKIFYPKHLARNSEMKEKGHFWDNHPQHEMGEHDGWTDRKRPIE